MFAIIEVCFSCFFFSNFWETFDSDKYLIFNEIYFHLQTYFEIFDFPECCIQSEIFTRVNCGC